MEPLNAISEDLWTATFPNKLMGMEIGARSSVVRLRSGGLAIISPGPFGEDHLHALRALGEVEALIAPNTFHHLFLSQAAASFPEAARLYAPGLAAKVPGLPSGVEIGAEAIPALEGALEHKIISGVRTNEVVFFHGASGTLILTDLAFNIHRGGLLTRLGMRLNGGFGSFGPTRVLRSSIHDRQAFASSLQEIASWSFERIVVAHGEVIETDGRAVFLEAFSGT